MKKIVSSPKSIKGEKTIIYLTLVEEEDGSILAINCPNNLYCLGLTRLYGLGLSRYHVDTDGRLKELLKLKKDSDLVAEDADGEELYFEMSFIAVCPQYDNETNMVVMINETGNMNQFIPTIGRNCATGIKGNTNGTTYNEDGFIVLDEIRSLDKIDIDRDKITIQINSVSAEKTPSPIMKQVIESLKDYLQNDDEIKYFLNPKKDDIKITEKHYMMDKYLHRCCREAHIRTEHGCPIPKIGNDILKTSAEDWLFDYRFLDGETTELTKDEIRIVLHMVLDCLEFESVEKRVYHERFLSSVLREESKKD